MLVEKKRQLKMNEQDEKKKTESDNEENIVEKRLEKKEKI